VKYNYKTLLNEKSTAALALRELQCCDCPLKSDVIRNLNVKYNMPLSNKELTDSSLRSTTAVSRILGWSVTKKKRYFSPNKHYE